MPAQIYKFNSFELEMFKQDCTQNLKTLLFKIKFFKTLFQLLDNDYDEAISVFYFKVFHSLNSFSFQLSHYCPVANIKILALN